ncbi:hypothetical protein P691DRAFT_243845 [Macrolepiota fuliginosa MF-IS2]|uniref:G domain-containing protein n=1 Tax=Macrolepiota fuliginosa MF-IS2 TaxID=1400762 RepID=A0A9P5X9G8_9AGAR|nr:hypothetical protein P691DRAFT_243845 [Macrolepiota fuliginosa MF-IS2]
MQTCWEICAPLVLCTFTKMFPKIPKMISRAFSKVIWSVKYTPDDILIAVVGHKGAGKSTLIDAVTGSYAEGIYNSLSPRDTKICSVPVRLPGIDDNKFPVHLIDTPGIDDSEKTMDAVLKELSKWKTDHCEKNVKFAGIIFVNSVVNPQPPPDKHLSHRHQDVLTQLCGQNWKNKMILVNTHLDESMDGPDLVEIDLANGFWKLIMNGNDGTTRMPKIQWYDHNDRQKSAWKILWSMIENTDNPLSDKIVRGSSKRN